MQKNDIEYSECGKFRRVSAGRACKVAVSFNAKWLWRVAHSSVQEAITGSGKVVAFRDSRGFFAHISYVGLEVPGIVA